MKSVFATFLCFTVFNVAVASDAVIWRQELSCGSNSKCMPRAMVVDSIRNEAIILGTSEQTRTKETDFRLWRINQNGNITGAESLGSVSKRDSLMVGPFGMKAIVKPDTGGLVRLRFDDADSFSLCVTDRKMQTRTAKLGVRQKPSEGTLLHDMTSCQNDNLLLVGQDGKDGIVIMTDLAGNVVWEKTFDHRQTDILSSVACGSDSTDSYVVGISASMAGKMTLADAATICLLRYDSQGNLKASEFFQGGFSPWPTSLPMIICLPSGVVLVVYDKSKNGRPTELYAKAYTRELTPLWEKQILQATEDAPLASFDICATPDDRFVLAGIINYWDLRIYECKADGTILQTIELDGEVGLGRVYVDYLSEKILVASATRSNENEKERKKIKLLALKPYKTNWE